MPQLTLSSPVGSLVLSEQDGAIVGLGWYSAPENDETPLLVEARRQLEAFFAGRLTNFDLPLALSGSPFYRRVWEAMRRIPYGHTRSYGEVAHELDSGPRAVGGACGRNPICIIVPCHRVLGSGGSIGGYGSVGLAVKRTLLRIERETLERRLRRRSGLPPAP